MLIPWLMVRDSALPKAAHFTLKPNAQRSDAGSIIPTVLSCVGQ